MEKYLIIVPTFNEAENIDLLLTSIFDVAPSVCVLFVDDNSQDQTLAKIVKHQQARPDQVFLLKRPAKMGFGSACIAGFRWGLAAGFDYLIQMDADLSHQPKYLPEVLGLLGRYDAVIGSRYVKAGGTKNWSLSRQILSKFGSAYARLLLGLKVADFTSGFIGWKRSAIEKINLSTLVGQGYVFQIELKYRAILAGCSYTEFPIVFVDRVYGNSKMSIRIALEAAFKIIFLRYKLGRIASNS